MDAMGFLGTLFDFSFSEFLTPKIIKILFGIGLVLAALGALRFIAAGFHVGAFVGVISLIISPLVFLLCSLVVRIYLEILLAVFRIAGRVDEIASRNKP
jgi:hypothetical protein